MSSSGSSFVSSAGPYAAALAALIYGDNLMKAGWGLDNNRKGYAASAVGATAGGVIAGMAAGASSGASAGSTVGPWGTVIGAVVGAIAVPVLSRLFGHNRNTKCRCDWRAGHVRPEQVYRRPMAAIQQKGGTFRSDRRWTDTFGVTSRYRQRHWILRSLRPSPKCRTWARRWAWRRLSRLRIPAHVFAAAVRQRRHVQKAGESWRRKSPKRRMKSPRAWSEHRRIQAPW